MDEGTRVRCSVSGGATPGVWAVDLASAAGVHGSRNDFAESDGRCDHSGFYAGTSRRGGIEPRGKGNRDRGHRGPRRCSGTIRSAREPPMNRISKRVHALEKRIVLTRDKGPSIVEIIRRRRLLRLLAQGQTPTDALLVLTRDKGPSIAEIIRRRRLLRLLAQGQTPTNALPLVTPRSSSSRACTIGEVIRRRRYELRALAMAGTQP
jgi:hypothetical protein